MLHEESLNDNGLESVQIGRRIGMNPVVFQALDIMWKGMLGIFVAIIVIMIFVMIMGKMGQKKDN